MKYTENFKLNVPELNEQYNLEHWTENAINIDKILNTIRESCCPIGMTYRQYPFEKAPWELWTFTEQAQWEDISSHYAGLFERIAGGNAEEFEKQLDCTVSDTTVTFTKYTDSQHGVDTTMILVDPNSWEQRTVTAVDSNTVTIESAFSDSASVTKLWVIQKEQLPNVTGSFVVTTFRYHTQITSGAFQQGATTNRDFGDGDNSGKGEQYVNFSLNKGNSTYINNGEVRPDNITIRIWKRIS